MMEHSTTEVTILFDILSIVSPVSLKGSIHNWSSLQHTSVITSMVPSTVHVTQCNKSVRIAQVIYFYTH